jgi:D-beta-D-heptose 7-phosphate kinase / D-beta-D-heptose 1-phosphate adenosyltransferase
VDNASLLTALGSYKNQRVLVRGDVMLDRFVYGSVDRISPEAPIPVMRVERAVDMPGGAGNVVRNAAAMGARAMLIGVVGDDAWAETLNERLALTPRVESCLLKDASRPTTVKTRYGADRQQMLRADSERSAPLSLEMEERVLAAYDAALVSADVVVLSDYQKGVLSDSLTQSAIARARGAGTPIVVDPKSRSFAKFRGATALTPNGHELQIACGHECTTDEQIVAGARRCLEAGVCEVMVVTRGPDGISVVSANDSAVHLRTIAREVYDVSGAGDTVVAAMSLGLAAGADVVEAAHLANVAAGIVVGKLGTAVVTTDEIGAALTRFDDQGDHAKIFTLENAQQLVRSWREQGLKIAFTNGCFDLLHLGHLSLLDQARRTADRLIVGLNSDLSIRRLKGTSRPIQSEAVRATVLSSLKSVDAVAIFSDDTPLSLIEILEPDVLVKGADYTLDKVVGAELVTRRGGKIVLAELVPGQSTTNILRRVTADAS